MKKFVFVALLSFTFSCNMSAQSVREMWLNMPDSIIPYLNKSLRQECIDFVDMNVKASVKNLFQGESIMDTLTTDYAHIQLNESSIMEMKMFPSNTGDSILCVVRTFVGPARESEVAFYNKEWNKIGEGLNFKKADFMSKPDTMDVKRYDELLSMVQPFMYWAKLSPQQNSITYSMSIPLASKQDKKDVEAISKQIKVNLKDLVVKRY